MRNWGQIQTCSAGHTEQAWPILATQEVLRDCHGHHCHAKVSLPCCCLPGGSTPLYGNMVCGGVLFPITKSHLCQKACSYRNNTAVRGSNAARIFFVVLFSQLSLWPCLLRFSLPLILLQSHWSTCCSSNVPSMCQTFQHKLQLLYTLC